MPKAPRRSRQRSSSTPFPSSWLLPLRGASPEDVVVDARGRLLTGVSGGHILRLDLKANTQEIIGNTGGRPLGLEVLADGRVLVCDAHKGLLRLEPESGAFESLVSAVDGRPLRFCSNAVASSDGTIYFTESTNRFDFEHYLGSFLEHRPSGRLFRLDVDGHVETLMNELYFPNGLALTTDESGLLFVETAGYRISRLDLAGPTAGQLTVIADNLPGTPDNMSKFTNGRAWVGMTNPRDRALDRLASLPDFVAKAVWAMPNRVRPSGRKTTWVMGFDEQGNVVADLQQSRGDYSFVTGVAESGGRLYCAGLTSRSLLVLDLPSFLRQ